MRDSTGNSVIILVIERKMTHTSASDFKLLIIIKKTEKLLVKIILTVLRITPTSPAGRCRGSVRDGGG